MKCFSAATEDRRLDAAARRSLRGSYIRLSDGIAHYELTGPEGGDIVVLTGGLMIPLFYWDAMAAALHAQGLRTLAYSGYGRGYSDRVQGPYDEALFVRQLGELITQLDLPKPYHLVGTSMGALVTMAYLRHHHASAATLTLVGPAGLAPQPALQRLALSKDWSAGLIARSFGRRILHQHLGHNVRDPARASELATIVLDAFRYEGSMYAFFDTLQHFPLFDRGPLYAHTGSLGVPVNLLWGRDDDVTPIRNLDMVVNLLKPAQCDVIEDCGHMAPFEAPTLVADSVASFLASHEGRHKP